MTAVVRAETCRWKIRYPVWLKTHFIKLPNWNGIIDQHYALIYHSIIYYSGSDMFRHSYAYGSAEQRNERNYNNQRTQATNI
jgi:hypothetical protein